MFVLSLINPPLTHLPGLQGVAILLPAIDNEFGGQTKDVKHLSMALYAGLIVGAAFWGMSADVWGLIHQSYSPLVHTDEMVAEELPGTLPWSLVGSLVSLLEPHQTSSVSVSLSPS